MPKNVLIVIDMQNDFADPRGSFFVKTSVERGSTDKLIETVQDGGWDHILATKDFHPPKHASFRDVAGYPNFPPHCVQQGFYQADDFEEAGDDENVADEDGDKEGAVRGGAKFLPSVLDALVEQGEKVEVFFKAFFQEFDSFGGDEYSSDYAQRRPLLTLGSDDVCEHDCLNAFTGSFAFPLSEPDNIDSDPLGYDDIQETATTAEEAWTGNKPTSLRERINEIISDNEDDSEVNISVCGLALDFCVKDTAINLSEYFSDTPGVNIKIIEDASSAADPDYRSSEDAEVNRLLDRNLLAIDHHIRNMEVARDIGSQGIRAGPGATVLPTTEMSLTFGGTEKSRRSSVTWIAIAQGMFVSAACAVFGSIRPR